MPRGTVKNLRLFTYHFAYQKVAGIDHRVGTDGPWEIKRVLGTVPVEDDGSALFRIPAKTPISMQPLDQDGKALALMRSWMTAMPGEIVSCVGCHEQQSEAPANRNAKALARPPSDLEPWHGPTRGFSFRREVQPVLDQYCVGCHNGAPQPDHPPIPDLRGDQNTFVVYEHGNPILKTVRGVPREALLGKYSGVFDPAYVELRRLVRVGGFESDLHPLSPKEFHADTSELVQMLKKGHHLVQLSAEAWDRLITWIDLNAPCHGTWGEVTRIPGDHQPERRRFLRRLYGGVDEDGEFIPDLGENSIPSVKPAPAPATRNDAPSAAPEPALMPRINRDETRGHRPDRGASHRPLSLRTLDLGHGIKMELIRIAAGSFVMGDAQGDADEQPPAPTVIAKPFWLGKLEVSNEQYAQFDPAHESRFEHRSSWIFSEAYLGWPLDRPRQPVIRVSWRQAMAFCQWLSAQTGTKVTLPTEAQWEYACRAGTDTPFFYGDLDSDFSKYANAADESIRDLARESWRPRPPDIVPRDARFNDHAVVTTDPGGYRPNAWGLRDMHGNVAEWTRSSYRPYPYRPDDGREELTDDAKVVRGGSWRDRPQRCRSAFRLSYPPYQRVFNVGFRVVIEP